MSSRKGKVSQWKISECKVVRVFIAISNEVEMEKNKSTKFISGDLAFIVSIKRYINFRVIQL